MTPAVSPPFLYTVIELEGPVVPITFHPQPGTVLMCDFSTGFQPPEIMKRRPVVILAPRRRHTGLCLVVPISTTTPHRLEDFHVLLPVGRYQFLSLEKDSWVKANLVTSVGLHRLDRPLVYGRYANAPLNPDDFRAIQRAVLVGLEIPFPA